jgi:hypothetical protein
LSTDRHDRNEDGGLHAVLTAPSSLLWTGKEERGSSVRWCGTAYHTARSGVVDNIPDASA